MECYINTENGRSTRHFMVLMPMMMMMMVVELVSVL